MSKLIHFLEGSVYETAHIYSVFIVNWKTPSTCRQNSKHGEETETTGTTRKKDLGREEF